uniref:Hemicentin-1 n=1 Tax=Cacopsylla melanoneura TaxID=428564 RepID=A0A8D9ES02_9HEMI
MHSKSRPLLNYTTSVNGTLWSERKWAEIYVEFSEISLNVSHNGNLVLLWSSTKEYPLIYYYMSVATGIVATGNVGTGIIVATGNVSLETSGRVTWTLNCNPPDIDGPPRNGSWGGWGAWECSVPCGGGSGIRYRECDHPSPNIFGAPCPGPNSQVGKCNVFKCGDISPCK